MAKNDAKFSQELLDQLLAGRDPKTVLDSAGLIGDLKKALAERMPFCPEIRTALCRVVGNAERLR